MKTTKINHLHPCSEAIKYMASQKTYLSAWANCERGDWMLWIAKKLKVDDKKLTMAKVMCAKQVEHLIRDQRSKDALQACFDYVNGKITRDELNAAANTAYAYAYDAADAAAYAAAYDAAYDAAADAAADAYADAAYDAYGDAAAAAARTQSLRKSADICRQYLSIEVLEAYKKLK